MTCVGVWVTRKGSGKPWDSSSDGRLLLGGVGTKLRLGWGEPSVGASNLLFGLGRGWRIIVSVLN